MHFPVCDYIALTEFLKIDLVFLDFKTHTSQKDHRAEIRISCHLSARLPAVSCPYLV